MLDLQPYVALKVLGVGHLSVVLERELKYSKKQRNKKNVHFSTQVWHLYHFLLCLKKVISVGIRALCSVIFFFRLCCSGHITKLMKMFS